jgi:hypothetical protein
VQIIITEDDPLRVETCNNLINYSFVDGEFVLLAISRLIMNMVPVLDQPAAVLFSSCLLIRSAGSRDGRSAEITTYVRLLAWSMC